MTLIPTSAIQHNGQASFVYLIQKNVAVVRNITPGAVDGPNTAVAGIQPGDVVANSSFEKLQPNSKVVLAKGGAPPANSNGSTAP
jgi:membrane fusion protein, multidrug efflux system